MKLSFVQTNAGRVTTRPAFYNSAALLVASFTLAAWLYLAFLRGFIQVAVGLPLLFCVLVACMWGARKLLVSWLAKDGDRRIELETLISRSFCSALIVLLFFPEYIASHGISPFRSVVCLVVTVTLIITQVAISLRYVGRHSSPTARMARLVCICFTTVVFALTTGLAIWKYHIFGYVGQDLAYFSEIMYTTLHGHLFWGTLLQDLIYSHAVTTDFAGHNSPIMFLFVPLYWLTPSPITLLIARNLLMTACAIPVWLIARRYFSPANSCLVTAAFLLTPAIFYQSFFDFYPLSIACLAVCCLTYFYLEARYAAFCICLVCTLLVREDLVFLVFGAGLLAALHRRSLKWTLVPLVSATAWGAFSFLFVIPHFLHGAHFVTDACFSHLGSHPAQMLDRVLFHPKDNVLVHDNIVYLKDLVTPAILMLLSPFSILSLPYIGINLLAGSGRCITNVISAQYSAIPAATLFLGALIGAGETRKSSHLGRLIRLGLPFDTFVPLAMIAVCIISLAFVTDPQQIDELKPHTWDAEARQVADMIPAGASVAAPRYMLPNLANRDYLYQTHRLLEYHTPQYEYLILDLDWNRIIASQDYKQEYAHVLDMAGKDPSLILIYSSRNYRVYRRTKI